MKEASVKFIQARNLAILKKNQMVNNYEMSANKIKTGYCRQWCFLI